MPNQTQETTLPIPLVSYQPKEIAWTVGFAVVSVIAPALLAHTPQNQWVTGTVVNAIIFLSAWRLGLANAAFVALLPSTVAYMRGLLPAPMAFAIPFIMASNVLMTAAFTCLKKRLPMAVMTASLVKFIFLYSVTILFAAKLGTKFIIMLQWPQLFTALAGGFMAIGIIRMTEKDA